MSGPGPATPLGLIAGRGALPRMVAEARAAAGLPYLVVALDGFAEGWVADHPHETAPITGVGRILAALRRAGCTHVTLAGGVERPVLNPLKLDAKALSWLPRLLPAMRRGDDALLRTVRGLLEAEGLELIGADTLLPGAGGDLATRRAPDAEDLADIARANAILAALAPHDVGQGAVVAGGLVLGIETVQGTDAMLRFVALDRGGEGGVLVKRLKTGQDRALDMPAIGPETVANAAAAGLSGIAIERGGVLVLEPEATFAAADAAGLFIWRMP